MYLTEDVTSPDSRFFQTDAITGSNVLQEAREHQEEYLCVCVCVCVCMRMGVQVTPNNTTAPELVWR